MRVLPTVLTIKDALAMVPNRSSSVLKQAQVWQSPSVILPLGCLRHLSVKPEVTAPLNANY